MKQFFKNLIAAITFPFEAWAILLEESKQTEPSWLDYYDKKSNKGGKIK